MSVLCIQSAFSPKAAAQLLPKAQVAQNKHGCLLQREEGKKQLFNEDWKFLKCTFHKKRYIKKAASSEMRLFAKVFKQRRREPLVGIEPTTDGLQNRCSTAELKWRVVSITLLYFFTVNTFGVAPEIGLEPMTL